MRFSLFSPLIAKFKQPHYTRCRMKKFFKIFFISLGLVLILLGVAMWLIFTPARITPIVKKQLPKFIDCRAEVGSVELTFFSTFPNFGIEADGLTLINPMEGAQSDTLLDVRQFRGAIDIKAFLKRDELILSDMTLTDGHINAYTGIDGKANFDIFPAGDPAVVQSTEEQPADTASPEGLGYIDADDLKLSNVDISYIDLTSGMKASVKGLSGRIAGSMKGGLMDAGIDLEPMDIAFEYTGGGVDGTAMSADLSQLSLKIDAAIDGDMIKAGVKIPPGMISFRYGDEDYLREAMVGMDVAANIDMNRRAATIDGLALSVNGLRLEVSGSAVNDTTLNSIATDLAYKFDKWPVRELMSLIPASMASYFKGIEAGGLLSSAGTVKGEYRDPGSMPLIDANVVIENADVKYPQMLPFPLRGVYGDIDIYTDLADDHVSHIRVNNFRAKTPESSLSAAGLVDRLFSDMHADLDIETDLQLDELATMLPEGMNARMKGRVSGNIKADATMSQITGMKLDRMKLSGLLAMHAIDVVYNDSLAVRSDDMTLDFSLPNRNAGSRNTRFAAAKITAANLDARMTGLFEAVMQNAAVEVETSDMRDTTLFPAMMCRFGFDALSGGMGSLRAAYRSPRATAAPINLNST